MSIVNLVEFLEVFSSSGISDVRKNATIEDCTHLLTIEVPRGATSFSVVADGLVHLGALFCSCHLFLETLPCLLQMST